FSVGDDERLGGKRPNSPCWDNDLVVRDERVDEGTFPDAAVAEEANRQFLLDAHLGVPDLLQVLVKVPKFLGLKPLKEGPGLHPVPVDEVASVLPVTTPRALEEVTVPVASVFHRFPARRAGAVVSHDALSWSGRALSQVLALTE